jgi:transcriptional regulator with XRE-family HTH domain
MTLSSRIRSARERSGLSQVKLANMIEVDSNTISRWERDLFKVTANYIPRLATVLNTTVAYLMGETNDPAPPIVRGAELHTAKEPDFIVERQQKVNPRIPTLEDFARIREASKNLESLEYCDLRAAAEMAQATLRAIEREYAIRTAQQDGALKSA